MIAVIVLAALLQSQLLGSAGQVEVSRSDTVLVGQVPVRLWGVSSFPSQTSCSEDEGANQTCDELAREILESQLTKAREALDLVSQQGHPHYASSPHLRCTITGKASDGESVGRCEVLIPSCYGVACEDVWYDLARELIDSGAMAQRRGESLGAYDEEEASARSARLGGWATIG